MAWNFGFTSLLVSTSRGHPLVILSQCSVRTIQKCEMCAVLRVSRKRTFVTNNEHFRTVNGLRLQGLLYMWRGPETLDFKFCLLFVLPGSQLFLCEAEAVPTGAGRRVGSRSRWGCRHRAKIYVVCVADEVSHDDLATYTERRLAAPMVWVLGKAPTFDPTPLTLFKRERLHCIYSLSYCATRWGHFDTVLKGVPLSTPYVLNTINYHSLLGERKNVEDLERGIPNTFLLSVDAWAISPPILPGFMRLGCSPVRQSVCFLKFLVPAVPRCIVLTIFILTQKGGVNTELWFQEVRLHCFHLRLTNSTPTLGKTNLLFPKCFKPPRNKSHHHRHNVLSVPDLSPPLSRHLQGFLAIYGKRPRWMRPSF